MPGPTIQDILDRYSFGTDDLLPLDASPEVIAGRVRQENVGRLLQMLSSGGGFKSQEPVSDTGQLERVAGRYDKPGMEDPLANALYLLEGVQKSRAPQPQAASAAPTSGPKYQPTVDVIRDLLRKKEPWLYDYEG